MNNSVTELHILNKNSNIFDTEIEYIIPLYQRAFAWEDRQLVQLIEDIAGIADDEKYYIGSLIVSKQNDKYEVVDGQQRLTSLFLLLNCLGVTTKPSLTFACREKSNYTLKNTNTLVNNLQDNVDSRLDMEKIEPSIHRGIKILSDEFKKTTFDKTAFMKKLSRVIIYRIEVPKHTDLNRYFEIMNTRGEQLEQHDILKAKLMGYLSNDSGKTLFATIWEACSDMTGYVQMHFKSKDNALRKSIFGSNWDSIPENDFIDLVEKTKQKVKREATKNCISDFIKEDFKVEDDEDYFDGDNRVRFDSIIDFPFFLLHTLKIYIHLYGITHENAEKKIVNDLLDDKKLVDAFDRVILHGICKNRMIFDNKEVFSRQFIMCLLRTRYLFDKYLIKREYANDNTDGTWSLKSLNVYGQQSQKKAYYKNTILTVPFTKETTKNKINTENIMIQSALRVSYTSPKVMHWITIVLIWLSELNAKPLEDSKITDFNKITQNVAIKAVKENFFDKCVDNCYDLGVNTPHIVFNYLDYLLWHKDSKNEKKYSDFTFEFRNSVEHWYPQKPSGDTFDRWKNGVDRFGNLCLVQSNINSRFSNMAPDAKKSTFEKTIAKGSIKLRIMSELTERNENKTASFYWKETACKMHEDEMIKCLKHACDAMTKDFDYTR